MLQSLLLLNVRFSGNVYAILFVVWPYQFIVDHFQTNIV